ncbi:MAG: hypothetical protein Q8S13_08345, partial [Dehalococcoidia bacterium]|nr:hypothetical protein [Dehalococcoidia bacterium]
MQCESMNDPSFVAVAPGGTGFSLSRQAEAGPAEHAIELRDVGVRYVDRTALDGVSFSVPQGAVV